MSTPFWVTGNIKNVLKVVKINAINLKSNYNTNFEKMLILNIYNKNIKCILKI